MEMTAEIIRRLNLAPCDIVAHSFGARVAILLAATYPELVGRMILTGAAGIKKTRYTLPAALFADFVGFLMASWTVKWFF